MTHAELDVSEQTSPREVTEATSSGWIRLLATLPVLVPVFVALLTASCTLLLLLRSFNGALALLMAVALTAVAARALGLGERFVAKQAVAVDLLAVVLALSFGAINAQYAAQNLIIGRDPGVYAVASQWLVNHPSVDIDSEARLFGSSKDIQTASSGFGRRPEKDHVYPQGSHGLPAVLAVVGTFTGPRIMYGVNSVLGGFALLAVYAFGRRVVGRWGALVAAGLLGASLPQIAFSRDSYTEPISQLLLFGGLALLLQARRGRPLDWAIAGLVVAGGCLTRIDSFLVLPPIIGYAGLQLAVVRPGLRRTAARDTAFLIVGAAVPAVLGYLDLKHFAAGYLNTLSGQFGLIRMVTIAAVVAGLLVVALGWRGPVLGWLRGWRPVTLARLGAVAGVAVVLVGVALAVRPLIYTSQGIKDVGQMSLLTSLQARSGAPKEPTRSYAESSVTWLSWYLGPVAVVLGLLGLALLIARAVRSRDLTLTPFFFAFGLTGLTYLINPSITPDQIWAMRRYVPIVLPGVALAAMVLVVPAIAWVARRSVAGAAVMASLLALAAFVPVLQTTRPFLTVAEGVPQLEEVRLVCEALPDDAAVLVVGGLAHRYPMTLRAFCDVPATWSKSPTIQTPAELARMAASLAGNDRQLYLIGHQDIAATVPTVTTPVAFNRTAVLRWETTLENAPKGANPVQRTLFVGKVGADGRVVSWATR